MKILIVDDNKTNLMLLTNMVGKLRDCSPIPFLSPADALAAMPDLDFDVALIDYMMPVYNGVEFLTEMLHFDKYVGIPIIFITADLDVATRMDALNTGAIDFLTKPVDFQEFKARVQNIAALADARQRHAESLKNLRTRVAEQAVPPLAPELDDILEQEREIIQRVTLAAGYKEPEAALHRMRVAAYSELIARASGLDEATCRNIRLAAPMFDNATALASHTSLLKRGKMTEADFRRRANATDADEATSSLLHLAAEIGRFYRERFDGQGYPNRLKGSAIPTAARIVAIAASLDALISERPFKQAWPFDKAVAHIVGKSGTHFDPDYVAAFKAALVDIHKTACAASVPMGFAAA